jgi:plasmid maintenance system antidote protein VapI
MKFERFADPFHPGEILREEFLELKHLSQRQFALQSRVAPSEAQRNYQRKEECDRPLGH